MNELQALRKVHKASVFLKYGGMIRTFLVVASFIVFIYFIWWQWQPDSLGLVALGFGMWFVINVALPPLFSRLNVFYVQMALSGVNRLIELGTIDDPTRKILENTKIEHWPDVISSVMPNEILRGNITP